MEEEHSTGPTRKEETFHNEFKSQQKLEIITCYATLQRTVKPFEIIGNNLADRWDPVLFVFLHALHKNDKKIPYFY